MRYLHFLGAIVIVSSASAAWAQTGNYGAQGTQPQAEHLPPNVPADAYRAWPGNAGTGTSTGTGTGMPSQGMSASVRSSVQPGELIDSEGDGAIPALVSVEQQEGDVTFINGGISDEDIAELKSKAAQFNLHLLISATTGEYISDVKLQIINSSGKTVLSLGDAGPYVYAELKPGTYTLEAISSTGESKTLKIKAPAKGSTKAHFGFSE